MPDGESIIEAPDRPQARSSARWSERLLPLMVLMTVGLTLFFLAASVVQLNGLNDAVRDAPTLDLAPIIALDGDETASEEVIRLRAYLALEANLIDRRHHAANVALMARIWTRYMGFITGMTLAMVGSAFVLGRLSGGGTLSGEAGSAKVNLQTASPGLFMIVLGSVLMIITITNHPRINVTDRAIYVAPMQGVPDASTTSGDDGGPAVPALPAWSPERE